MLAPAERTAQGCAVRLDRGRSPVPLAELTGLAGIADAEVLALSLAGIPTLPVAELRRATVRTPIVAVQTWPTENPQELQDATLSWLSTLLTPPTG